MAEEGLKQHPSNHELARYIKHLSIEDKTNTDGSSAILEEIRTTPLFSWQAKEYAQKIISMGQKHSGCIFSQYGLIGERRRENRNSCIDHADSLVLLNTNAPWSAFLCGSQGSGKSYTLSCILENCLMRNKAIGKTVNPLSGLIFYYDPHPSESICEAAFLASDLRVRVLVSPSNYYTMQLLYRKKIGLKNKNLMVVPLLLSQKNLNTDRILKLMAFTDKDGVAPLYLEVVMKILRDMAVEAKGSSSFNYQKFRNQLKSENLSAGQQAPLNLRLQLLDSFLDVGKIAGKLGTGKTDLFTSEPGTLIVVDLTDPFVDSSTACILFDMCLSLFLENAGTHGKVIALDEAHKFMNESPAAETFTDNLLTAIREQRHKAARIVIATQEPTISPKLLDLCSMTFVHRFQSPEWFSTLKSHLAAVASPSVSPSRAKANEEEEEQERQAYDLFNQIVNLDVGQSLLFSPSAMFDITDGKLQKLGRSYVRFKTRRRITADGGQSIMAMS